MTTRSYNLYHIILSCLLFLLCCPPNLTHADSDGYSSLRRRCLQDESSALLYLKNGFSVEPYSFHSSYTRSVLPSWKSSTDCCSWEGITCNNSTGHVIGLDISGRHLSGNLNSSGLLHLRHLERLNLADNDFKPSVIPAGLDGFASLTHLNLSYAGFSGQIPTEISSLTKLVSLDLSYDSDVYLLKLQKPNLGMLVKNLSGLRELRLDGVNISMHGGEWCKAISDALPNLQVLSLKGCLLSGPIDASLLNLKFLSQLLLGENNLSSLVPGFLASFSSLTSLELDSCELYGEFPQKVLQLPNLEVLSISSNPGLTGSLPEFRIGSLIRVLSLSFTSFFGHLPDSIGNLKILTSLELDNCRFSGAIPSSLANLTNLLLLSLSSNNFSSWVPFLSPSLESLSSESYHDKILPKLSQLYMGNNSLAGTIHPSLFSLRSLKTLRLDRNQLGGKINEFKASSSSLLEVLDLSNNKLEGPIPKSLFGLKQLQDLRLSYNNFSGIVDPVMFHGLENLTVLDLSWNSLLSVSDSGLNSNFPQLERLFLCSCNINKFPTFLNSQEKLIELDLSDNKIHGQVPIWIWKNTMLYLNLSHNFLNGVEHPIPDLSLTSLAYLDLHSNQLQGPFPILPPYINFLSISDNKLIGEIPSSICNASGLAILDLSHNNMSGLIPQCLGDNGGTLVVLNLRGNNFHGTMPHSFTIGSSLRTLDFNGNHLEGKVPRSLANCSSLDVLDLGNNQINDTFPIWLGSLPMLRVLVLGSNNFHGSIGDDHVSSGFPMLHILDLSSNYLNGSLPPKYFRNWKAMMVDVGKPEPEYLGLYYYQDRITLTVKGLEMDSVKILTILIALDLSDNQFEGEIPESIGGLKKLEALNLSRNNFKGSIPLSMENLIQLESLDLSRNKLSGEIPWQLRSLTFLSFLNLSYNFLVGGIPQGSQFFTFTEDSYKGNSGLCGFPLSVLCGDSLSPGPPSPTSHEHIDSESTEEFDWKFLLMIGYGGGVVMGAAIGYLLFWTNLRCITRLEGFAYRRRWKNSMHRKRGRRLTRPRG